MSANREDTH